MKLRDAGVPQAQVIRIEARQFSEARPVRDGDRFRLPSQEILPAQLLDDAIGVNRGDTTSGRKV